MPELRYEIAIDVDTGAAKVVDSGAGGQAPATPAHAAGGGSGGTGSKDQVDSATVGRVGNVVVAVLKGFGPRLAQAATGMINAGSSLFGGGLGGAAGSMARGAAMVGSAFGPEGAAIGQVVGQTITGLTRLAETLAIFSGPLYQAMTRFDMVLTAVQVSLANALGPSLTQMVEYFTRYIIAASKAFGPFVDAVLKLFAALAPLQEALQRVAFSLVRSLAAVIEALARLAQSLGALWVVEKLLNVLEILAAMVEYCAYSIRRAVNLIDMEVQFWIGNQKESDNAWARSLQDERDMGKAQRELAVAFDRLTGKYKEEEERLAGEADKIFFALITAAGKWTGAGPQAGIGKGGYQPSPVPMPSATNDGGPFPAGMPQSGGPLPTWAQQQLANKNSPIGYPRTSPAAVHFHTADNVNIQAGDEDRLHSELIMWQSRVWEAIQAMHDGRGRRLASARCGVQAGVLGGQAPAGGY